jgi:LacI family gluconate utilization system Gnt-I transcriptional repressor
MSDVAALAQVSPSTVSLYLRHPEAVSLKNSKIIQDAIDQLGYVPSMIAGGLAAASSRVVSVIVPSVKNAFFAETVSALQKALSEHKLQVLLGHSEYALDAEENLVKASLSWAPAALVLTGLNHSDATRKMLQTSNVPLVEIWELDGQDPIDMAVGFSHYDVGAITATHLVERGRTNLVYLSGRIHQDKRAAKRALGFTETARAAGLTVQHLTEPDSATADTGAKLVSDFLKSVENTQGIGIGCSNDWVALGAIFELQRRGIEIPQQASIIGFGDLSFAAACNPPLSTIRPHGESIGAEAAALITARLADKPVEKPVVDG